MPTISDLRTELGDLIRTNRELIDEIEKSLLLPFGSLKYLRDFRNNRVEFLKRIRALRQYMTTNMKAAENIGKPLDTTKYKPHHWKPMSFSARIRFTNERIFDADQRGMNEMAFLIGNDTVEIFRSVITQLNCIEGNYLRCVQIPFEIVAEQEAIKTVAA